LPDGRLAWQTLDARNYRIRDLATSREETLVKNPEVGWVFDPSFSPRGDRVAVFWNRKDSTGPKAGLWILSWPSREAQFVAPALNPIGWSEDSEWIYAYEQSTREVVRVSPRSSKIERVGSFPQGSLEDAACSLTPERQSVVCALLERSADAWVIDHFDPEVRPPAR
jgi:Tol biopolymer transport system component